MTPHILVVEDDIDLREILDKLLQENNYIVKSVPNGALALKTINKFQPDLVLLDLGLPDIDGQSLCKQIKAENPEVVVFILTAHDNVSEKIKSFDLGADDYVTKPFEPEELIARIKTRLKAGAQDKLLKVGDLTLDAKTIEVKRAGKLITLTAQEFKLLEYLMANKGDVLTRDMILNRIWLYSDEVDTRVVDVYIGYLRKKIDSGFKNKLIKSIRGFGYTIKDN